MGKNIFNKKGPYLKIKRLLDFTLSLIGLIIISPILLITVIAIKLESKGPVIFEQERLGVDGNPFIMYKFRSMCIGAEKSGVYSSKGDARVTKVGKFIRATSIDEFPQFLNIIKGEMSIIGPRPVLTYHPMPIEEYTDEQLRRFNFRPGVTGWAQINGRKGLQWDRRLEYDVEYVDNISFALDVKIFFRTVIIVLRMQDNTNNGATTKKAAARTAESKVTAAQIAATEEVT